MEKYCDKEKWILWFKILVACLPTIIIALPFNDIIEEKFYNYVVVAVSYTHLENTRLGADTAAIEETFGRSDTYVVPVSYTHLDVYKRQHSDRLPE